MMMYIIDYATNVDEVDDATDDDDVDIATDERDKMDTCTAVPANPAVTQWHLHP